jgi:Fe-S cluster assembly protein SufD
VTAFSADRSAALDGPAWLQARRAEAFARFAALELPTAEDEIWRYIPIADLDLSAYELSSDGPTEPVRPPLESDGAGVVVLVDGRLVSVELSAAATAAGVTVTGAGDAAAELLPVPDPDALTALHDAFVPEVVTISVPKGVAVEGPIVVAQSATGGGTASFPHLVVDAGEASEVTVVDQWTGGGGGAYVSPVVELRSGPAANVRYVQVQDFGGDVWSTGLLLARPGRDATTKAWVVALGGRYARLYLDAQLEEQAAAADLAGVYFGDGEQVHDFRSLQDHHSSRSVSNFLLKGAVVDDAHAVYTGMIRVREGAKATESFLANRNLVLSDGAHVDSVPNLEIVNENDIKSCGHAPATGPVDEEHVFYLESRGVPTDVAQRLIVFGFFDDVIGGVPVEGVRAPLRDAISRKLAKVEVPAGA